MHRQGRHAPLEVECRAQKSAVVFAGMDVFYVKDILPLRGLDHHNIVYVPDFLAYDGVNDRS